MLISLMFWWLGVVNDEPRNLFTRLRLKRARNTVGLHTQYVRKKEKKKENSSARCRPRLQPRAATCENKKENTPTRRRRRSLRLFREIVSRRTRLKRGSWPHNRVSFNNPDGGLNQRPDFSESH